MAWSRQIPDTPRKPAPTDLPERGRPRWAAHQTFQQDYPQTQARNRRQRGLSVVYGAGLPGSAIGDPHSSQNFALDRKPAPQVMHATAAVTPAPPIPGYDYPDRPNNRAAHQQQTALLPFTITPGAPTIACTTCRTCLITSQKRSTLADHKRVLSAEHPNTLAAPSCLAGAYLAAGRHTEAVALYERTLADREPVLGAEHPDTLGAPQPRRRSSAAPRDVLCWRGRLQD